MQDTQSRAASAPTAGNGKAPPSAPTTAVAGSWDAKTQPLSNLYQYNMISSPCHDDDEEGRAPPPVMDEIIDFDEQCVVSASSGASPPVVSEVHEVSSVSGDDDTARKGGQNDSRRPAMKDDGDEEDSVLAIEMFEGVLDASNHQDVVIAIDEDEDDMSPIELVPAKLPTKVKESSSSSSSKRSAKRKDAKRSASPKRAQQRPAKKTKKDPVAAKAKSPEKKLKAAPVKKSVTPQTVAVATPEAATPGGGFPEVIACDLEDLHIVREVQKQGKKVPACNDNLAVDKAEATVTKKVAPVVIAEEPKKQPVKQPPRRRRPNCLFVNHFGTRLNGKGEKVQVNTPAKKSVPHKISSDGSVSIKTKTTSSSTRTKDSSSTKKTPVEQTASSSNSSMSSPGSVPSVVRIVTPNNKKPVRSSRLEDITMEEDEMEPIRHDSPDPLPTTTHGHHHQDEESHLPYMHSLTDPHRSMIPPGMMPMGFGRPFPMLQRRAFLNSCHPMAGHPSFAGAWPGAAGFGHPGMPFATPPLASFPTTAAAVAAATAATTNNSTTTPVAPQSGQWQQK